MHRSSSLLTFFERQLLRDSEKSNLVKIRRRGAEMWLPIWNALFYKNFLTRKNLEKQPKSDLPTLESSSFKLQPPNLWRICKTLIRKESEENFDPPSISPPAWGGRSVKHVAGHPVKFLLRYSKFSSWSTRGDAPSTILCGGEVVAARGDREMALKYGAGQKIALGAIWNPALEHFRLNCQRWWNGR